MWEYKSVAEALYFILRTWLNYGPTATNRVDASLNLFLPVMEALSFIRHWRRAISDVGRSRLDVDGVIVLPGRF
jgi:hypothetical protein